MDIYDITLHQSWISAIEAGVMRHRLQTESACPRDIWLRRAYAIVRCQPIGARKADVGLSRSNASIVGIAERGR
jgi:hypothetical protein